MDKTLTDQSEGATLQTINTQRQRDSNRGKNNMPNQEETDLSVFARPKASVSTLLFGVWVHSKRDVKQDDAQTPYIRFSSIINLFRKDLWTLIWRCTAKFVIDMEWTQHFFIFIIWKIPLIITTRIESEYLSETEINEFNR